MIFRGPLQLLEEEPQEPAEEGVYRYQHPQGPVHLREQGGVLQEDEALPGPVQQDQGPVEGDAIDSKTFMKEEHCQEALQAMMCVFWVQS